MRVRRFAAQARKTLKEFPAAVFVGPRQCGKTTLARALGGVYFDLEQDEDRVRLDALWPELKHDRRLIVLDEAQTMPSIFPRLRGAIDADRKRHGRFLLLGSVSPLLMREVAESLAGRMGLMELTPFLLEELTPPQRGRLWSMGGFPDGGVLRPKQYGSWQKSYLALMAQRDLPDLGLSAGHATTTRLFQMLAALHGAMWNASEIGRSLAVSYHTAQKYVDVLEGAFLIRRLAPYAANLKKRLVKAPKIYWRDTGLLHALRGLGDPTKLFGQPWVGASFEGHVIEQIIGKHLSRGRTIAPYFYRTHLGEELDFVYERDGKLEAVEIKLTSSPNPGDIQRARRIATELGAERLVVICRIGKPIQSKTLWVTSLWDYVRSL